MRFWVIFSSIFQHICIYFAHIVQLYYIWAEFAFVGRMHQLYKIFFSSYTSPSDSDVPLTPSVVGDVTTGRSKVHGELVSLKQRPMTSRAVCYRIELAFAKILCLGKPAKYLNLTFKQFYPRFSRSKQSNSSKSVWPYFYIGGFVAVYLSEMAATMVGPIHILTYIIRPGVWEISYLVLIIIPIS